MKRCNQTHNVSVPVHSATFCGPSAAGGQASPTKKSKRGTGSSCTFAPIHGGDSPTGLAELVLTDKKKSETADTAREKIVIGERITAMCQKEQRWRVTVDYMKEIQDKGLETKRREEFGLWMLQHNIGNEIASVALNSLDRYLALKSVDPNEFELLAASALLTVRQ